MKVRRIQANGSWTEAIDLLEFVASQVGGADYGRGELETLKATVDNLTAVVGKMIGASHRGKHPDVFVSTVLDSLPCSGIATYPTMSSDGKQALLELVPEEDD